MRKTFANTIRPDLRVNRRGRRVEVSGNGLTYRSDRANARVAETINSKIPVAVIAPPFPR
jgi:hypothetical protein